jgi:AP-2 complex subunit mu-1
VKLGKFDSDRIISFVPPDGEFELMRYRSTENVNLPFKVHAIVNEVGKTKVEYSIGVRANFGSKLFATNVVVRIPTPLNTARITERCTQGKAKYEPSENNIVWKIGRFTGQSEFVLSAEAELTSMTNQKAWSRPPLSLNFSLLMFTSSGLLVRYLKVFEKSNYSSVKWVRYMTRAGSYEIRSVPVPRPSSPLPTSPANSVEGSDRCVTLLFPCIERCVRLGHCIALASGRSVTVKRRGICGV